MGKLEDKGINVTEWLFKALWGLAVFFLIDLHNQTKQDRKDQAQVNKEIIEALHQIQQTNAATSVNSSYLLKEQTEMKQEIKENAIRIRDLERKLR